jgi:phosphatidylglycerol:prolipoprotein diacylglycerol transferase
MLQDLFRIPGTHITLHGYGLMLVIGFLLAMMLAKFLARRSKIDPEIFVNAALIALVAGVIGARLSHVLENWGQYTNPHRSAWDNFKDAINVSSGGLTYYGGFLLATPACIAYGLYRKVPLRTGMDIIAPALMVGLGIGRIGCFLNGCCYGAECNLPWAVRFPYYSNAYLDQLDRGEIAPARALLQNPPPAPGELLRDKAALSERPIPKSREQATAQGLQSAMIAERAKVHPVHPAQLYSTITALLLAGLLVAFYSLPHTPGHVFALMCMLEGATRFMLEMLRVEPPVFGTKLSLSMWIGVWLVGLGALMWVVCSQMGGVNRGGEQQPA